MRVRPRCYPYRRCVCPVTPRVAALCLGILVFARARQARSDEPPTLAIDADDGVRVTEIGLQRFVGPARGGHFVIEATCSGVPCQLPLPGARQLYIVGYDGSSEYWFDRGRRPLSVQIHRASSLGWFGPLLGGAFALGATGSAMVALASPDASASVQNVGIGFIVAGTVTLVSSLALYAITRGRRISVVYAFAAPTGNGAAAGVGVPF